MISLYTSTLLLLLSLNSIHSETVIDITPYAYPKPWKEGDQEYKVAILSTNDLHGTYFPMKALKMPDINYKYGGLPYLGKYIEIMRKEWGKDFLYFDGGDQFQGSIENSFSKGELMTDYFNKIGLDAATFGNHEWDDGIEFIKQRLEKSNAEYIVSNIQSKDNIREFLPKQRKSKVIDTGKVKIGLIGLTVDLTNDSSSGADMSRVKFLNMEKVINEESLSLKTIDKADVVVLIAHLGLYCDDDNAIRLKLQMRTRETVQKDCSNNYFSRLINRLAPGVIDVIVTAHTHQPIHQWINGIPIISNMANSEYASLIYLPFRPENGKMVLLPQNVQIEGPLPVCEKVFSNTLRCSAMKPEEVTQGQLVDFTFHNSSMGTADALNELTTKWWAQYEKFINDKITYTNDLLKSSKDEENPIGNLYTDFLRKRTKADVAIINPGFFRVNWDVGYITFANIIQMSPYSNFITTFSMTGKELRRMMFIVQKSKRGFYHTSGLKQVVKMTPSRLIALKLFNGVDELNINDKKMYKVTSIDFLVPNGGDDFKEVMKWYVKKNLVKLEDIRYEAIKYFRNIKAINVKDLIDVKHPRIRKIKDN